VIRPVSYAEILNDPNAKALLHEYALECSLPELGYASPQPDLYELLEKSGGFQAFGVYEDEMLVGFATVLIYVLPHYGQKVATSESIFIAQSHRASSAGVELLAFIEDYARQKDCLAFLYSASEGSRFDRLLSTRYRHSNNVYLRNLA
jgi:GNAT superfamily N-acetyltransferase